jgi:hypothetical protein
MTCETQIQSLLLHKVIKILERALKSLDWHSNKTMVAVIRQANNLVVTAGLQCRKFGHRVEKISRLLVRVEIFIVGLFAIFVLALLRSFGLSFLLHSLLHGSRFLLIGLLSGDRSIRGACHILQRCVAAGKEIMRLCLVVFSPMPRHNSKRKKNQFMDTEAEGSGSDREHAGNSDVNDDSENSEDRAFIDNTALTQYHPSAPPPLFLQEYYDRDEPHIEEVLDEEVPLDGSTPPPPPQANRHAPAFAKSKVSSYFKPSGKPPAKPPAGVSKPPAAAPPAPPEPPKEPVVKLRRPKARAPKKLTALIQSHLVPSAMVGSLTYNLVTLIPNIECEIEESWKGIQDAYALVAQTLRGLSGLFGAFMCIETHGTTHKPMDAKRDKKKKTGDKNADPAAAPNEQELDFFETNDGTLAGGDPVQYMTATRGNKLTGKAHMHILCWFSDHHFPRIDFSALKRLLLDLFPNGDVHEVKMKDTVRNKSPHYVRATAYIFKSIECPATLENWHKYVDKDGTPPLPEFYHSGPFLNPAEYNECVKRWLLFLSKISQWCRYTENTAAGAAAALFHEEHQMSEEEKDMRVFASMLELLGIIVCPSRERNGDRYYELEKRDDYKVLRSLGAGHDFFWLHQRLQAFPASIGLLLKYRERIPHWVRFTNIFQSIEKPTYDWIELKDGYYNIHSNVFRMKDDPDFEFIRVCFRSYPYTVEQVKTKKPERWLKLLDYVCEKVPVKRLIDPADPFEASTIQYDQVDRERLLRDFALLLRRRKPKQPVPFLYGVSNSGKTTLTSFIRCIYPIEAIAAINNSSAPFSGISEDTMLVYNEEFKCETISREELLVLLDGAQPLTVRKLHQDARLIANPLMPIILQDNYYPTYYHDDSKALENRLSIHYFPRSIGSVDLEEYSRIADEHLFVIRHLHEYLELQENAPRTSA